MRREIHSNWVSFPICRRAAAISLAIVSMAFTTSMQSRAQSVATPHVRDVVRDGAVKTTGRLPADRVMNLDVVLPLTNPAGLDSFLRDLYNPASPSYQHYLKVAEFTAKFGPSQKDYDALVSFAKTHGFTVTGGTRAGSEVQIAGAVATVEAAFHISMLTYRHPTENRDFYSPDREPTVDLPFKLWHISGLDNYSLPRSHLVKASGSAGAHIYDPPTGNGPNGAFLNSDMRRAYYSGTALTGAGQNLGIFTYGGTNLADVQTYLTNTHQTSTVPIVLFSTDNTSVNLSPTCNEDPKCNDAEQTLDIVQAIGMAPGLASVIVFIGSNASAILGAMVSHDPLPATNSDSWFDQSGPNPAPFEPYFKQMAAQGQSFFVASGDNATSWSLSKSVAGYAEDPFVTGVGGTVLVTIPGPSSIKGPTKGSVGGTVLITTPNAGAWASETAWVESAGGVSPHMLAIPPWQQLPGVINAQNRGSTAYRNGPDVAANAVSFYSCSNQGCGDAGGTSFAAPMWAAYVALVNQQRASVGGNPIGFINPTIYAQNLTSSYSTNFHDITSGTSGSYSATTGYDLTTGWGSPKGGVLIQNPGVAVPFVTFEGGNTAIKQIRGAGLVPKLLGANPDKGYVASQSPLGGVFVPPGSTVTIRLVIGPTP